MDGDTIMVLDVNNQQYNIGLDGIDAPESKQDFGSRSKTDRYGAAVGKVMLDSRKVNLERINRGMA